MNYEGIVSSVNKSLWTFQLNSAINVHVGCLAVHNEKQRLPELGASIKLYNVHSKLKRHMLVLCEHSRIVCNYYEEDARENKLLKIISEYGLRVPDLFKIDYNIDTINTFIKKLVDVPSEEIIFEVLHLVYNSDGRTQNSKEHNCFNQKLKPFRLITISSCQYIDLQKAITPSGPPWSFGVHHKINKRDFLIGYLHINKYGFVCLQDTNYNMTCIIATNGSFQKSCILNKLVLIKDYCVFTETFKEFSAPNLEYIFFNIADVIVLNVELNRRKPIAVLTKVSVDIDYLYHLHFKLLHISHVNLNKDSKPECWLEVLNIDNQECSLLGLNVHQIQIIPYLERGMTYHVYHSVQMVTCKHPEFTRLKKHLVSRIFAEKHVHFIKEDSKNNTSDITDLILNVPQALEKVKESTNLISFQGLLSVKKFTPALSSRTTNPRKCQGFGTPGSRTHTLLFTDDTHECSLLLYLNDWENLQIPLGLIPDMRVCVRNVVPQKGKYLKCCVITTFEVLSYEPQVIFNTANLQECPTSGYNEYSFLGLGHKIPCNVLVWAKSVQLTIRSVRIFYKCEECNAILEDCYCKTSKPLLETTITLLVYDEMGQSLVISKSIELLRLLLGLTRNQWRIWCQAFEHVGEFVFDDKVSSEVKSNIDFFCTVLGLSIKVVNAMKITEIELMCRKMDTNLEDNDGMPRWFCIDARKEPFL